MSDLYAFSNQLALGVQMTILLALGSLILGLVLGLAGAAMKMSSFPVARFVGGTYTTVIRGLPELLVVLIIYFGTAGALTTAAGWFGYDEYVELSPYAAGVFALGLTFGAYATEVLRGAMLAIPPGQMEAARALGMGRFKTFWRITLPQVWRVALPGLGNLFLVTLKDTSLVSVISLEELMRKSIIATEYTKKPFTFFVTAAVLYLLMTIITMIALHHLEKRANRGVRRASA